MSCPLRAAPAAALGLLLLLLGRLAGSSAAGGPGSRSCPAPCRCFGDLLDCSRLKLSRVPERLPQGVVQLDLSHNRLSSIKASSLSHLHSLREIKLNNNELETIPNLGPVSANITLLSLTSNKIGGILPEHLKPFHSLETLDLSNNNISELKTASFPSLQLKYLYINSNRITSMEPGAFDSLSSTLQVLKLNRNKISAIPQKMFKLSHLQHLELNRNKIKKIDGLTFQGLTALKSLKMQRNGVNRLMDGAFWGLTNMEVLQLDHNNLTEITKGWLYGLLMLQQLHLSQNAISRISPDAWEFCQKLSELDLTFNHLARLDDSSFVGLSLLVGLYIGNNKVNYIADCAFRGLSSLKTLDLKNNEISWTIEDMNGAFSGLDKLRMLILQGNRIRSITKKAFSGLDALEHLDLSNNAIMSVQGNAFSQMKKLEELHLNTSSLLCDCQLKWLPQWVSENNFQNFVNASCAHPPLLKGRRIFAVSPDEFVCDDFPKPQITVQPETQSAIKGSNLNFICSAASSSDSPMTFAWKKDNELLHDAEMENYAHLRAQGGEVMEYTTILRLRNVEFSNEGKYQCVISNHFGSSYSVKAKLTVNMLPSFTKMPMDLTIRAGATARLECAAVGHPVPQIAWQKDGGTDFPAARKRRMHVMPEDDVFFIVDVKIEDTGVYSCTAQNTAGSISANATLTVLETPSFLRPLLDRTVTKGETAVLQCIAGGSPPPRLNWTKDDSPLVVTERHFFAAGNQLLIIVDTDTEDAGKYTCEMSNTLGTERGNIRLNVIPTPTCDSPQNIAPSLDNDGWATVGVVIIAVVCCVVGTSLVWVVIIYHTRRRNEDCSITNTDETNLPADIPSYLSSQGTLAERQDGSSENGSHHQFITSSMGGYFLQQRDSNGICHLDNGSETDLEVVTDPFLCHYLGTSGTVYLKGNAYGSDAFEAYHTSCSPDQRTVCMDLCDSSYLKKKECYPYSLGTLSHSPEDPFDQYVGSIGMQATSSKLLNSTYPPNEGIGVKSLSLNSDIFDLNRNQESSCITTSSTFMGTFGKSLWRPQLDSFSSCRLPASCQPKTFHNNNNPQASLDFDSEAEEDGKDRTVSHEENSICTYKQAFENFRTPTFQSYDLNT
ncbi:leucine-rich repeats and immunoglobulin-like domains protein 3 isoform X1 [Trachemys scripta elegans]|uniref:leucine-rich repeats and immunoglobulin-like domains protein 3 isoform X1 n=1 Tax=Trachemys scripta elegans TaxID=31138 RepID=UPI001556E2E1|nr:leucine-rich repeats and immunoglobulin-like domains protein 3 isoform X1 [Trachemys scripta elegans]